MNENTSSLLNRFSIVKQIPVFRSLNWLEIHRIATHANIFECKKGEVIRREGDEPDAFYCLVSGRVQAYTNHYDNKENVEAIHRGMHFGIVSLLTGERHSLNFEVINDAVILKIHKDEFHNILRDIPKVSLEISQSLSKRVRSKVTRKKTIFESTIVSVYSPIKGAGSSTYAVNLALRLQQETKKKVLLINIESKRSEPVDSPIVTGDSDPHWKKDPVDINWIMNDHDNIFNYIDHGELNVGLLHISFDPDDASVLNKISKFVSTFVDDYHYIVVDLPNQMNQVVFKTLTQSDLVYLVTMDRKEDLDVTRKVVNHLKADLKDQFKKENLRVIISGLHQKDYKTYDEINKAIDYDVFTVLPYVSRSELTTNVEAESMRVTLPETTCDYARFLKRIARNIGGVRIGLALGGGAALGIAHIGVLRVLEEEDIPVDVITGASMGALIASFWAVGNNSSEIEKVAKEFRKKPVMMKLLDPILPKTGLIAGKAIQKWLTKRLGPHKFYDTKIPLKVVAYDLNRREDIIIEEGSIVKAIGKSIAIPGIIQPIMENGQLIIDGGVLNPLPTNVLSSSGITKIISVNVLPSPDDVVKGQAIAEELRKKEDQLKFTEDPIKFVGIRVKRFIIKLFLPNISDIIVQSFQASEYVIAEQSARYADVAIHPDLSGIGWYELYKVEELIQRGEEAARGHLDEIKKLVEA